MKTRIFDHKIQILRAVESTQFSLEASIPAGIWMDHYRQTIPRCLPDMSNCPTDQFFSLFDFFNIKSSLKNSRTGPRKNERRFKQSARQTWGETQVLAWSPILEDGFLCAHKRQS